MRASAKPKRLVRWLLVAAWALVIFGLSSVSGSAIASAVSRHPVLGIPSFLFHVVEYAVLAGSLVLATDWRPPAVALALALLLACSLYGIGDVMYRRFVPGRHGEPIDWVADTAGAGAAIATISVVRRRRAQADVVDAR